MDSLHLIQETRTESNIETRKIYKRPHSGSKKVVVFLGFSTDNDLVYHLHNSIYGWTRLSISGLKVDICLICKYKVNTLGPVHNSIVTHREVHEQVPRSGGSKHRDGPNGRFPRPDTFQQVLPKTFSIRTLTEHSKTECEVTDLELVGRFD